MLETQSRFSLTQRKIGSRESGVGSRESGIGKKLSKLITFSIYYYRYSR
ncbi:hypothetical protein [Moorena sp. SIO1G6]|nr:hypothetical protein [Moorena sp. SIO1G6]